MQVVIGIDPSLSGTGVVVLNELGQLIDKGTVGCDSMGTRVLERVRRYSVLLRNVMAIVGKYRPEVVCIEGYSLGSHTPGVADRLEFGGLLRWTLVAQSQAPIHEVAPTSLKKWATGKGSGDKTGVISQVTSRYGVLLANDNEYDAYALARIGLQLALLERPATVAQSEVIDALNLKSLGVVSKKKSSKRNGGK